MIVGRRHNTRKMHSVPYLVKVLRKRWEEWLELADEFDRDHNATVSLQTEDGIVTVTARQLADMHVKITREL